MGFPPWGQFRPNIETYPSSTTLVLSNEAVLAPPERRRICALLEGNQSKYVEGICLWTAKYDKFQILRAIFQKWGCNIPKCFFCLNQWFTTSNELFLPSKKFCDFFVETFFIFFLAKQSRLNMFLRHLRRFREGIEKKKLENHCFKQTLVDSKLNYTN